jgi:hypothetical protein
LGQRRVGIINGNRIKFNNPLTILTSKIPYLYISQTTEIMNNPLDSTGVTDTRDLIEYKEYLESEILDAYTDWAESHNEHKDEGTEDLEIPYSFDEIEFIDEEAFTIGIQDTIDEYEAIRDFCQELEGYGDFEHGETLIAEDYFEEYAKELTKDCGYIPDNLPSYIENNIDWEGVADDLKLDYTEAYFEGIAYLMRA